ncbi:MAG: adenosylmethionine decarboxylase [Candidatus Melainabacteria bacterium]|nr:adenosylmethionine decarboxylase [Candidatus Melainabacteria bacterium]
MNAHLGQHLLVEFYDCNSNVLNNPSLIEQHMKEAALACKATIVQSCFHRFSPYGVSGVVVIAESHLAIHTWPEFGYAAVDLFTCGTQCDPEVAFEYLREHFHAGRAVFTELHRGLTDASGRRMLQSAPTLVRERDVVVQATQPATASPVVLASSQTAGGL